MPQFRLLSAHPFNEFRSPSRAAAVGEAEVRWLRGTTGPRVGNERDDVDPVNGIRPPRNLMASESSVDHEADVNGVS